MNKRKILLAPTLAALLLALCLSAFALRENRPYIQSETQRIVDGVVYMKTQDGWCVTDYFATENLAAAATEIRIAAAIDGVPVTQINPSSEGFAFGRTESYPSVKSISIPASVTYIGYDAFSVLDGVEELTIPNSVKTLGQLAFSGMESLKKLCIGKGVTIIPNYLCKDCKKLEKVVLKGAVTEIREGAFEGCEALEKVNIPQSMKRLFHHAFSGTAIRSVTLPCDVEFWEYWETDEQSYGAIQVFDGCKNLKKVTYTSKKAGAKMTVANSLFAGCKSLKTVVFPADSKSIAIANGAFFNCKALKTLQNAESVTEIGKKAFKGCSALNSFTLSAKITSVGAGAFAGTGLKKLIVSGTKKAFLSGNGSAFLKTLPANCKIYVKNNKMKNAFVDAGWQGKILINEKLA